MRPEQEPKAGPKLLMLDGKFETGEKYRPVTILTMAYLCPCCPDVHVELRLGPEVCLHLRLTDKEAEELGRMLISPEPIDPEFLGGPKP